MDNDQAVLNNIVNQHFEAMKHEIRHELATRIGNNNQWHTSDSIYHLEATARQFIYNVIDWLPEKKAEQKLAWLRTDLLEKRLGVPVGEVYYGSKEPLPYRWVNEETFEVCYCGEWLEAQSIDWDFTDKLI